MFPKYITDKDVRTRTLSNMSQEGMTPSDMLTSINKIQMEKMERRKRKASDGGGTDVDVYGKSTHMEEDLKEKQNTDTHSGS